MDEPLRANSTTTGRFSHSAAHGYRIVIIGKTNFSRLRQVSLKVEFWAASKDGEALDRPRNVAAARSTGLRPLHFSSPESFRGCHLVLQDGRYNYKIVMIGKTNFQLRSLAMAAADREQPSSRPSATMAASI